MSTSLGFRFTTNHSLQTNRLHTKRQSISTPNSRLLVMRHRMHRPTNILVTAASATQAEDIEEDDDDDEYIELPDPEHILIQDDFSPSLTSNLRLEFDTVFANPLQLNANRFCWDYWNVPNQYTLLRTTADQFFSRKLYTQLEGALTAYGESVLGCRGISPVWLSCYVEGCRQEFHTDAPHGPWAFVLSLTNTTGKNNTSTAFTGGQTKILQPHVLDYWSGFDASQGLETGQLMTKIEPCFSRLTVFDPRLPHGVEMVNGTHDVREGRLVLHGWFTSPSPFVSSLSGLSQEQATPALNKALEKIYKDLAKLQLPLVGTLCVRVYISPSGSAVDCKILTNTVMHRRMQLQEGGEEYNPTVDAFNLIVNGLFEAEFPSHSGTADTEITLPFVFE